MKRIIIIFWALMVISLAGIVFASEGTYVESWALNAGNGNPTGVISNSTHIGVFDLDGSLYWYLIDGTYQYAVDPPGDYAVAQNETAYFFSDGGGREIYVTNKQLGALYNFDTLASTGTYAEGLTTNRTHLYMAPEDAGELCIFTLTGTYSHCIDISGTGSADPHGLCLSGEYIWVMDRADDIVYKLDHAGNKVHSWSINTGLHTEGWGLTVQGDYIYVSDYDQKTMYVYEGNVSAGDTTAPVISNAICTSCISGTNNSLDSTPTVNITITDASSINGSCIGNNSGWDYKTCLLNGGSGTQGVGDTWVTTLPSNQSLTNYYHAQPVYFWANDSEGNYNIVYNLTMNITLVNTKPTTPYIYYPSDGEYYYSVDYINFSSTDIENHSLTYDVYINDTINVSDTAVNVSDWKSGEGYYKLEVSADDGINSSDNSTAIYFYVDSTEPSFLNYINTTGNVNFMFNVTLVDNLGLGYYIFSWNGSGSWVNDSEASISGVSYNVSVEKTKVYDQGIGWRVYANDSAGNLNVSLTKSFSSESAYSYLNGLHENRTYEYETTANISTNLCCIDILDGTNRYINESPDLDYKIDLLRINEFSDGNISLNISSGSSASIIIDNRTDLYNASFNISGIDYAHNLSIRYGERANYNNPIAIGLTDSVYFNYTMVEQNMPGAIQYHVSNWSNVGWIYAWSGSEWLYYDPSDILFSNLKYIKEGWNCSIFTNDDTAPVTLYTSYFNVSEGTWFNWTFPTDYMEGTLKYRISNWGDIDEVYCYNSGVLEGCTRDGDNCYGSLVDIERGAKCLIYLENGTSFNLYDYLNYSSQMQFPGNLTGDNLYQNQFIYSGTQYKSLNLSYLTAGAKTIYVNFSNQGNYLTREGYLNFTITAFDLDKENGIDYRENFSNDHRINSSSLLNVSAPISVFDDFESETPDRWECTNISGNPKNYICKLSMGKDDDYFIFDGGIDWGGFSSGSIIMQLDVTAPEITLENISYTKIIYDKYCSWSGQSGHSTYVNLVSYATDGTNEISLYTIHQCSSSGFSSGSSSYKGMVMNITKNSDGTIDVYENNTLKANNRDLSSLNSPINLRWKLSAGGSSGSSPGSGSSYGNLYLRKYNTSGIRLKRLDGIYEGNVTDGNFESSTLKTSSANIARAYLSLTEHTPINTSIDYYLSNNNGSTWESVVPDTFHTFSSVGKALKVRFVLNSTENISSPFIPNYRVQIIPAPLNSLFIDIGNNGLYDYNYSGILNSTNTPLDYTGSDDSINKYINSSCSTGEYCTIPISIMTGSGGNVQIDNFNLTENINPVRLNATFMQDSSEMELSPTYTGGTVEFSDIRFDYRGSRNITVYAHNGDYSYSINTSIFAKYSPFNITYPIKYEWWELKGITSANQSNIEPWGQNSTTGVWRFDSNAYDGNVDIYSRYNNTENISCVTKMEFKGQNFSVSNSSLLKTLNITNLTTTGQKIIEGMNDTNYGNIWTYTQINCSENPNAFVIPYFCFFSMCSDCVLTHDYQDTCDVIP